MGLRPLLFHVDAGWNTDQAVDNIEKLVDGLGLDLYTEVVNWEEMKDLQLAFLRAAGSGPGHAAGCRFLLRPVQFRRQNTHQVHHDRRPTIRPSAA